MTPENIENHTDSETERSKQRDKEDHEFTPVIVKRSDEITRHPDDVLENAISEGLEQIQRPLISLILSSISAGLILGFTVMAVAVVTQATLSISNPWLQRIFVATVYPLGFVICILSGTQLFTEHTATAVYPILDKKAKPLLLLRLWFVVIAGNLLGAFISAGLLIGADEIIQVKEAYILIAEHLTAFNKEPLLISALLAGWLMAQGGWLVLSCRSTISQIICIYIVTFLIGIGGLHHSIAGSVEMITGYLISDHFSIYQLLHFIGLALIGNLIGGSLFVATLNYAYIRQTQTLSE